MLWDEYDPQSVALLRCWLYNVLYKFGMYIIYVIIYTKDKIKVVTVKLIKSANASRKLINSVCWHERN